MKRLFTTLLVLMLGFGMAQTTIRIGLAEDPDILDPDLARTYVGRIVFTSVCNKLFDITPNLEIVGQLATSYQVSADGLALDLELRDGVTFHDGTVFDAEAVKYNINRSLTLPGSTRASEISQVSSVEVTGPLSVRINLTQPFSPLIAQFADRAGMMISPTAAEAAGEQFGANPVCSGPYKFVERVAQDRIVLEKFDAYWNADAYSFDRVIFLPIPDTSVRLANLQSGDLDLIERPSPTDLGTMAADSSIAVASVPSLGYQGITVNIANPVQHDTPLASDQRVREAFELSLDRDVINNVVFDGQFMVGNQAVPPTSPWYTASYPISQRDVEKAKALLAEAGYSGAVPVELMVSNSPDSIRVGEVIQAMAAEAGFNVTVRATEFATALDLQDAGQYDAFQVGWSGRLDPDGNIHSFETCTGALNQSGYCDPEVDKLLNDARAASSTAERKALYDEAALRYLPNRNIIYLYHTQLFFPHTTALKGFVAFPDGMIRLQGVSF
ncbi:MAG TPA: ABC transporter substrate-binding protein [Trueperaceae bacterium]|nr:ABC transporter substrate-binding protein [Trueperaceae bacterium]